MEENAEIEQDLKGEDAVDELPPPDEKPAALTLVIQSWATPLIGILMLVAGLFGGYYLRPVLSATPPPTPVAIVEEIPPSETEIAPTTGPISDAERAVQQAELMTAVVERTRHFRGDPNAPITIIEFSDFL